MRTVSFCFAIGAWSFSKAPTEPLNTTYWGSALSARTMSKFLCPGLSSLRINFALHHIQFFSNWRQPLLGLNKYKSIHPLCDVRGDVRRRAMERIKPGGGRPCFKNCFLARCDAQCTRTTTRPHHEMKINVVGAHTVR